MKTNTRLLLPLLVIALALGCDNQNNKTFQNPPQKKLRLGFVANNANDYWYIVRLGCDNAVRQLGDVDLSFRAPGNRTAAAQQEILSDLIASGVDGIAISPIDAENQTEFLNSLPASILLVCADSDAGKSRRACYVGTDNVAAGKQAADLLKAALPQGGKIALFVGYTNAQNIAERIAGVQQGLEGSNLQIVETLVDDLQGTVAQKNAEETLKKYPDLAGMAGLNSYSGPAILTAVRSAGKAGQVKIVCFDEESETLAGIAAGDIYGTITQKPFWIGYQATLRMGEYLRGDKTQLAQGKIFIPTKAVTQDNVAAFQIEFKNMLVK
ncbi:MAG TPA: substrate-binding domain-containing protein [Candidatus Acidoferrum sp.]|nr:substrate-binding domain-containing protein [Candidatus Acidoferrum sp.]